MCDTVWSILIIVPASFLHAYPRSPIESQPSPVGGEVQHALDEEWAKGRWGWNSSYLSWPTRNEQVSFCGNTRWLRRCLERLRPLRRCCGPTGQNDRHLRSLRSVIGSLHAVGQRGCRKTLESRLGLCLPARPRYCRTDDRRIGHLPSNAVQQHEPKFRQLLTPP